MRRRPAPLDRRFRRSAHIAAHWSEAGLALVNFATGLRTIASPLAVEVLDFFDEWRTLQELRRGMSRFGAESLDAAVQVLEKCTLLEREDARREVERRHEAWAPWNPAAGFFHFSTKDVPFELDHAYAEQEFRRHVETHPMPALVKKRGGRGWLPLPSTRRDGEFRRVLESRRTWRRFARRQVDLESLGTLFDLTFRTKRYMDVEGQGRVALKTSPSGGARHPLEAYVLALNVKGLGRGLYHYRPDRHGLERLTSTATPRQVESYLPSQYWYRGAAALVLMTAVFERCWWRYDDPRGYRAVLIEAGHFCQTFLLTATWLGLAPFCSMALADSRIERDLGIDGVGESVLYAAGVGVRPPGVEWAPTPSAKAR